MLCKILLACTTSNARLVTDMDLIRFIPMMVTRIIISLKKVATERQPYLGPEVPTEPPTGVHDYYSPNVADIVPLSTLLKDERV